MPRQRVRHSKPMPHTCSLSSLSSTPPPSPLFPQQTLTEISQQIVLAEHVDRSLCCPTSLSPSSWLFSSRSLLRLAKPPKAVGMGPDRWLIGGHANSKRKRGEARARARAREDEKALEHSRRVKKKKRPPFLLHGTPFKASPFQGRQNGWGVLCARDTPQNIP